MKHSREPGNKSAFMVNCFSPKMPRVYNRGRIISSIDNVGKSIHPHTKE
jgi:hypothetical protein